MNEGAETAASPFKKARAKKLYIPDAIVGQPGDSETDSFVEMLNRRVLESISAAIRSSKSVCLDHIIEFYTTELERTDSSNRGYRIASGMQIKDYPSYFKHRFPTNRYFTDSFLTLASVFKVNPLADKNDLSHLLDQEPECQESEGFAYINIQDVLKTKGNAIHGPRRENIGRFNRKLFETYSKKLEPAMQERLVVNLKFYPCFSFLEGDQVLSSDYVLVTLFDGPRKVAVSEHILVIHKSCSERKFCTIRNESTSLFIRSKEVNFCSTSNSCRKINLMYLPTLSLYSIEFLCENALAFAYDSFFKNCQTAK